MKPSSIENAWTKSVKLLFDELGVKEGGLSDTVAAERLEVYGPNSFGEHQRHSMVIAFFSQFKSPLILILLSAAGVTWFFHDILDSLFILLAVSVSVGLGFYQEYKAERATAALRSYIEERVRVLRNGREVEESAAKVVPGDIILLRAGERVSADGRLIDSYDLAIDESILTGESMPVFKSVKENMERTPLPERTSMVFGGTYVSEGQGQVLVTATGSNTEFGKIAEAILSQGNEKTPLQKAVSLMGWLIAGLALILISGVYALGIARDMEHMDVFLVAIAIAVSIIPEALPPGLTAILAVGVERIAKQKGIVRSLLAAEALGSATVVITDKTGTLTTGSLELVEVQNLASLKNGGKTPVADYRYLLSLAVANTNAIVTNPTADPKRWKFTGRHLDVGILKSAQKHGVALSKILKESKPVKLFSSAHKYSIHSYAGEASVLGAPDILLKHSNLSETERAYIHKSIEKQSSEGKRILGVGRSLGDGKNLQVEFLGVLVFYDPLRPNIKEAIKDIEDAGCRVIMATGDLPGTAGAIARMLGWNEGKSDILSGEDMRAMTDAELVDALSRVRVFARMTPEDKYRVVEILEGNGEVVAMLGDGVNDAPSLKRASIGVAVGSGTDVAKGVADLVLLDDNFHTIKAAIDEGRLILANIRKTFVYLMSNSFDGIVLLGGSLVLGLALPLSPLQIIWVNFFTGSIPAIAYAFDRERLNKRAGEHAILSREVLVLSFGIGLVSSVSLLALYYFLATFTENGVAGRTFLFTCFSSYILFIAFSFRNLHKSILTYHIFENKVLNLGVLFGSGMLLLTIYLPFFQELFGTVSLSMSWLCLVGLWILGNVFLVEVTKWLMVERR